MANGCPMCGGTEFDSADHVLQGGNAHRVKYCPEQAFFRTWSGLHVRARACLGCGYIALFVDDLDALREQA